MPDVLTRRSPGSGKVVRLPPVWGPRVLGQVGDVDFTLVVDGRPVCRRYRAPRTGWLVVGQDRRRVRIAGSGGHATRAAYRRRGYNARLDQAFLADARRDGFDVALLFCVAAQAPYNARLGWRMTNSETCPVSYQQPRSSVELECPSHIWTGVQALVPGIDVQAITGIEIEGLPW